MRTIWKFPLSPGWQDVPGKIRHVGVDPSDDHDVTPTVWCEVDPNVLQPRREVCAFGTGHPLDGKATDHVGSVVTPSGLVWHVYEYVPF